MPQQHERHGRPSGWDWPDSQPSRSDLTRAAVAQDDPQPVRGKAQRWSKDQCKKSSSRQHEAVIQLGSIPQLFKRSECGWRVGYTADRETGERGIWYSCYHERVCGRCGKVIESTLSSTSCPLYESRGEQKERVAEEARNAPPLQYRRRMPVITGPQGYRKKKGKQVKSEER